MSFFFGTFQPSNGAMLYEHHVHPGGCSSIILPPEASFSQLTDATHEPDACKVYSFDDRSPLANGGGNIYACSSESSGEGWTTYNEFDACYGVVVWSPSNFVFRVDGLTSLALYPLATCVVSEDIYGIALEYACEGGSVVRGVMDSSKCSWNEANELECNCIPKYSNSGCPSLLGEYPKSDTNTASNSAQTKPGWLIVIVMVMAKWRGW